MQVRNGMLAFFCGGAVLWAQATATLNGHVQDASGGVVAQASVSLHNSLTGFRKEIETEASGAFVISNIPFRTTW